MIEIRQGVLAVGAAHLRFGFQVGADLGSLRGVEDGAAIVRGQVRAGETGRFPCREAGDRGGDGEGDAAGPATRPAAKLIHRCLKSAGIGPVRLFHCG